MPNPALPSPVSPELQVWLHARSEAIRVSQNLRTKYGASMMLKPEVVAPELLPEPMRSQAIEYLRPEEELRMKLIEESRNSNPNAL